MDINAKKIENKKRQARRVKKKDQGEPPHHKGFIKTTNSGVHPLGYATNIQPKKAFAIHSYHVPFFLLATFFFP